MMSLPGTKLPLSEASHICVIIEICRHIEMPGKFFSERKISPLQNIRRSEDRTSIWIQRSRRSNSDRQNFLLPNRLNGFHQAIINTRLVSHGTRPVVCNGFYAAQFIGSNADVGS